MTFYRSFFQVWIKKMFFSTLTAHFSSRERKKMIGFFCNIWSILLIYVALQRTRKTASENMFRQIFYVEKK
jgi:hypothetical protein